MEKGKQLADFTDLEVAIILRQTVGELDLAKSKLQAVEIELDRRNKLVKGTI